MSKPTMLEIGNSQYNTSSLKEVTGGPNHCKMHYPDFEFEFFGDEAAQIWDWWTSRGSRP
jgi:hypothetical protein